MAVTECLVIVIAVGYCLCCMSVCICHHRTNIPKAGPNNRVILMIAGVRFSSFVNMYRAIFFGVNFSFIIKPLKQDKPRIFQRLAGFIIIFIKLCVIRGFKLFLMAKNLESDSSSSRTNSRFASKGSVKHYWYSINFQPNHSLMLPRWSGWRSSPTMSSRTGNTFPYL